MINFNSQLLDYVVKMEHNQKLLEWGLIRNAERLNALEGGD